MLPLEKYLYALRRRSFCNPQTPGDRSAVLALAPLGAAPQRRFLANARFCLTLKRRASAPPTWLARHQARRLNGAWFFNPQAPGAISDRLASAPPGAALSRASSLTLGWDPIEDLSSDP